MVTFAFGTTAPAESCTVALNVPVSCCPKPVDVSRMRTSSNAAALVIFFNVASSRVEFIAPPRISFGTKLTTPVPDPIPETAWHPVKAVSAYVVDSYYSKKRRNLPPMVRHCQEKKRFFKESVHLLTIGGKLAVLIGPESWGKPANRGLSAGLVRCLYAGTYR